MPKEPGKFGRLEMKHREFIINSGSVNIYGKYK